MLSKWYRLKSRAVKLRLRGLSIRDVEKRLEIPRSTLSGWFQKVQLSQKQKEKLHQDWLKALVKARKKAVGWHNLQKQKRLEIAREQAVKTLKRLDHNNLEILELALAILYLGEGSKIAVDTSVGSSDPLILKFFIACLRKLYSFDINKIRCFLHLRADQDPQNMKRFWSKELGLPITNFRKASLDKRTFGSKTYPYYKGVCVLSCGTAAIQRKLLFLSKMYCEKITNSRRRA